MAEKTIRASGPEIFIANKTFLISGNLWVRQGDTVEKGHPIMRGRKEFFRPFSPTFPLPDAEPKPTPTAPEPAPAGGEEAPA